MALNHCFSSASKQLATVGQLCRNATRGQRRLALRDLAGQRRLALRDTAEQHSCCRLSPADFQVWSSSLKARKQGARLSQLCTSTYTARMLPRRLKHLWACSTCWSYGDQLKHVSAFHMQAARYSLRFLSSGPGISNVAESVHQRCEPPTGDHQAEEVAEEVFDRMATTTRSKFTGEHKVSLETVVVLSRLLLSKKVPRDCIVDVLPVARHLFSYTTPQWHKTITTLRGLGFTPRQVLPLLDACPEALQGRLSMLQSALDTLRALGLCEGRLQVVATANPEVLRRPHKELVYMYNKMLETFTHSQVIKVIVGSPDILTAPWGDIQDKLDYVCYRMAKEPKDILKSNMLSHSLLRIECRHLVLERAGKYVAPDRHGNTNNVENASLRQIVDTTDETFARKVAGMLLSEYECFIRVVELEKELQQRRDGAGSETVSDTDSDAE